MPSGADRLLRQMQGSDAGFPELPDATVTDVAGGVVTVSYKGASLQFPHVGTLPAVGDVVVLVRWAGNWLILGTPTGFPV